MKQCMDADNLHRRLKKIIGQVQAIDRMVDEDVPCEDILSLINAAKSALNGCGKVVLEGHIKHCVRDGIEHGDADKTIESFTKAVERFANAPLHLREGLGIRRAPLHETIEERRTFPLNVLDRTKVERTELPLCQSCVRYDVRSRKFKYLRNDLCRLARTYERRGDDRGNATSLELFSDGTDVPRTLLGEVVLVRGA